MPLGEKLYNINVTTDIILLKSRNQHCVYVTSLSPARLSLQLLVHDIITFLVLLVKRFRLNVHMPFKKTQHCSYEGEQGKNLSISINTYHTNIYNHFLYTQDALKCTGEGSLLMWH